MNSFLKIFFLILALLSGLSACRKSEPEQAPQEHAAPAYDPSLVELSTEQAKSIGLTIGHPRMLAIGETVRATGKLDVPPQNQVSVAALYPGFVRWTDILQGARVQKGQRLAVIYNPELLDLHKRLTQARADERYRKQELDRQQALRSEEINSQKTLERARADYQSARAEADALEQQVQALGLSGSSASSTYEITAPLSGYISRVDVNIGKQVAPGQALFEIVSLEHIHAELFVFERDAARIRTGQRIRFSLPGEPEAARTATVYLVGRTLEPDRTIRIHGHLDREDEALIPGLFIQAAIETDTARKRCVPDQAIVRSGGKTYVFVPADKANTYRLAEVRLSASELGYTQIAPLDPQVLHRGLVTQGAFYLLSTLKMSEGGGEPE